MSLRACVMVHGLEWMDWVYFLIHLPLTLVSDFFRATIQIGVIVQVCYTPQGQFNSLGPQAPFFGFEGAWYAKIRHVTSFGTSMGMYMETPPFTMTSFQSARLVAWCEYSSSETDGRIVVR